MKQEWTGWHTLVLLVAIVAAILIGLLVPESFRQQAWAATLLTLMVFAIVAGHGITGKRRSHRVRKPAAIGEYHRTNLHFSNF